MSREVSSQGAPPLDATGTLLVPEPQEQPLTPAVRLYPSHHRVSMTRYATSTDPRGYLPVYEWQIPGAANPFFIMIDAENGYVQFTGIWKALGHLKADVVKLIDSAPEISEQVKKIRGGYLKIQGTWLPFETARTLARRVAYHLRFDLVPIFGPTFPEECLQPGQPGFGQLLLSQPKQRASSGRRPRVDRRALSYGQSDGFSRPAPASAYHDGPAVPHPGQQQAAGPQRRAASSLERYQPYGQWPPAPSYASKSHLPTPPSSGEQQYHQQYHQLDTAYSMMMSIKNSRPAEPSPGAPWGAQHYPMTWHPGQDTMHAGVPLMQQNGNVPAPLPLPKARSYTSASDQDAISSLMSMSGRSHPMIMTPKSAGSLYSLPSSQCPSPKSAPAPAHHSLPSSIFPVTTSAPLSSFSTRWSPGLLAPPGHYSLKHAHESHLRSGSAEPADDEEAGAIPEAESERSRSAPPLISPTTRLPFHPPMAVLQRQAFETASQGPVEASA